MVSRRTLELVPNESARKLTFRKRKKSLYKKAEELSTLCGIDVCLIIFPDQKNGRPAQPETWPLDTIEVNRILNMYKATKDTPSVLKRTFDLSHFYQAQKMEIVDDNVKKLHHEIDFSKELPTWDARIDDFDEDELAALLTSLEAKLEVTTKRIDNIERNQFVMNTQNVSGMVDGYKTESSKSNANHTVNLAQEKEEPSYTEPYLVIAHHQTNSKLSAFNMNSINSTSPMMQPRNEHFTSQHEVRVNRPIAYDAPRKLLPNNACASFTDNCTPAMQLMLPYVQYQMLPSEFHAQNEKRLVEKI